MNTTSIPLKVLVFTPFASYNGAETMLWNLLKHSDKEKFQFAVYSYTAGPLAKELPVDISFFTTPKPKSDTVTTLVKRIQTKIYNKLMYWVRGSYPEISKKQADESQRRKEYIQKIHAEFNPDLWYINTVQMSDITLIATEMKVPFCVHFHDLLYVYTLVPYINFKNLIQNATALIGCANCVCDKLVAMGAKEVYLQYECVDIEWKQEDASEVLDLKKRHHIATDSFVWLVSGTIEYRKGIDFVPELARLLGDDVTIVCLGSLSSGYAYYIEQELVYQGITNVVMAGFQKDDYRNYLNMADGFLLTSREDPFPLVMIEAAATGLPIVAFDSGGVSEFVQDGMGEIVTTNTVEDMADAMRRIMTNQTPIDREKIKARAAEFDARKQTLLWEDTMTKIAEQIQREQSPVSDQ